MKFVFKIFPNLAICIILTVTEWKLVASKIALTTDVAGELCKNYETFTGSTSKKFHSGGRLERLSGTMRIPHSSITWAKCYTDTAIKTPKACQPFSFDGPRKFTPFNRRGKLRDHEHISENEKFNEIISKTTTTPVPLNVNMSDKYHTSRKPSHEKDMNNSWPWIYSKYYKPGLPGGYNILDGLHEVEPEPE